MQICADRVGIKVLRRGFARDRPQKAARAMSEVEQHAPLARLNHIRLDLSAETIDQFDLTVVVHVRVNVARTQMLQQLFARRPPGISENFVVNHDRNAGEPPRCYGTIDRRPAGAAEMRRLDADDHVSMPLDHLGRLLRLHILGVAFVRLAHHARADDVEQSQHARLGMRHNRFVELLERAPAAAARIHYGRGSRRKRIFVGVNRALVRENMHVQIDQTRNNIKVVHVDHLRARRRSEIGADQQ